MDPSERFPETSWTLLARAREQTAEGVRAREDFAHRYYKPVREFLLVLVKDPEQAGVLAQEFFARLSTPGNVLERVRKEKGSFHNYVQEILRNLATDYHRRRSKEALEAHPDQLADGGWETIEAQGLPAAEAAFHDAWVKLTLAEALGRVRALCLKRNQEIHFKLFEARYLSEDPGPSWQELGARCGMDQKVARERAETVVRHFRLVLRRMLRNEIMVARDGRPWRRDLTEDAVDKAIKALLSPLKD